MSVCEPEHDPPHLCQQGSTCVPLPNGYTCHCPLGTTGNYCEQGMPNAQYIVHSINDVKPQHFCNLSIRCDIETQSGK